MTMSNWSCSYVLSEKLPLLSAEPHLLSWEHFLFSQTRQDPQAGQLNTLLCLMLSEGKEVPLITKPLQLVLPCPPNTHCTQSPRSAENRGAGMNFSIYPN